MVPVAPPLLAALLARSARLLTAAFLTAALLIAPVLAILAEGRPLAAAPFAT